MFASCVDSEHAIAVYRLSGSDASGDGHALRAALVEFAERASYSCEPVIFIVLEHDEPSLHVGWAVALSDLLPEARRHTLVAVVTACDKARLVTQGASWYVSPKWELYGAPHIPGAVSEAERRLRRPLHVVTELLGKRREEECAGPRGTAGRRPGELEGPEGFPERVRTNDGS